MRKYFGVIAFFLTLAVLFVVCEIIISVCIKKGVVSFDFVYSQERKTGLYVFDPSLGWRNRPNFDVKKQWPHRTTREKINKDGWRDKDYSLEKRDNVYRIAILGCSFTYGYGVNREESYPHVLEVILNKQSDREIEVINFGVNGYGLAQMVLNYEKYVRKYKPDLVILQFLGFNAYRTLYTSMWLTQKPTFALKDEKLVLINYPVPKNRYKKFQEWLIRHSVTYRFILNNILKANEIAKLKVKDNIKTNQKLHNLTVEIFKRLKRSVDADKANLLVYVTEDWQSELCTKAGVECFNLYSQIDKKSWEKRGSLSNPEPVRHWSPLGNEYVARCILKYLDRNGVGVLLKY